MAVTVPRPDLESRSRAVLRARSWAYLGASAGVVAIAPTAPENLAGGAILAIILSGTLRLRGSLFPALIADLAAGVALWWLFGPLSGADLIPIYAIAVGALMLPRPRALTVLIFGIASISLEIALHFVAGSVALPLFHPAGPISDGQFLADSGIQIVFSLGIGLLFLGIAARLRNGEEALRSRLERQIEANEAKDRFIATVSHELRTPLTSVLGFTRALIDGKLRAGERKEFLHIMWDQASELHARIEDLITANRLTTGELLIDPKPVDTRHIVETAIRELGPRAQAVEVDVPADMDVWADPPRLRQMIRNLVDNALNHGAEPVTVEASRDRHGRVEISVTDAGPGIDEDQIKEVLQPHPRLLRDETTANPGLGLGLPLVARLAEAQGGELGYANGPGATFRVTLSGAPTASALLASSDRSIIET